MCILTKLSGGRTRGQLVYTKEETEYRGIIFIQSGLVVQEQTATHITCIHIRVNAKGDELTAVQEDWTYTRHNSRIEAHKKISSSLKQMRLPINQELADSLGYRHI